MRVLVLGAYGLIGISVVQRLLESGYEVTGLGRSVAMARLKFPQVSWLSYDISHLTTPESWVPLIEGCHAVVNCAGALQDGARDDLRSLQSVAMRALFTACEGAGTASVVQISATGAELNPRTVFMRTKAEADLALKQSSLRWTILRPGLVIGPTAYGATALLRALAGCPVVLPVLGGRQPIQTVHVADVADAVLQVVAGCVPSRQVYDLVEDQPHSLLQVLITFRAWLGLRSGYVIGVPDWIGVTIMRIGDLLGHLGWRTPLRTTTLIELNAGIIGNSASWKNVGGKPAASLAETLSRLPSTLQERWFARLWLLKPMILGVLALFWCASGIIALVRFDASAAVLLDRGVALGPAYAVVSGGALLDLALGLAILYRASAFAAAIGMVVATTSYLVGGTFVAPDLWVDPLGTFVKTLPALMLALVAAAIIEER